MVRIIEFKNIPKERQYAIDDNYEDIKEEFVVSEKFVENIEPFTCNGILYSPHCYIPKAKTAIYEKKIIPEEVDCRGSDEIVCPYCGERETDSWDCSDSGDNVYCEACGGTYGYEREVWITYDSYKISEGKLREVNNEK